MKWITWENVGVDRIACAWLIRRAERRALMRSATGSCALAGMRHGYARQFSHTLCTIQTPKGSHEKASIHPSDEETSVPAARGARGPSPRNPC